MASLFTKHLPSALRTLVIDTAVKIDQVQAGSKPRQKGNAIEIAARQRRAEAGSLEASKYQALTGASKDYFFEHEQEVNTPGYKNYTARVDEITSESRHSDALYTLAQKLKVNALTHLTSNNPEAARVYLIELKEIQHNLSDLKDNVRVIELEAEIHQLEQHLDTISNSLTTAISSHH